LVFKWQCFLLELISKQFYFNDDDGVKAKHLSHCSFAKIYVFFSNMSSGNA